MKIIDTLICSDLHLGTKISRADLLLKELKQYQSLVLKLALQVLFSQGYLTKNYKETKIKNSNKL